MLIILHFAIRSLLTCLSSSHIFNLVQVTWKSIELVLRPVEGDTPVSFSTTSSGENAKLKIYESSNNVIELEQAFVI